MSPWVSPLWSRLVRRLRSVLLSRSVRGEIERELGEHLEQLTRQLMEEGMSPAQARREAVRRFGNLEKIRSECLAARDVPARSEGSVLTDLGHDLLYGWRMLRRSPGFAVIVVITLALGIGGNAAIFSIVDGVLLRPLPYQQPSRLVRLWQADRLNNTRFENFSLPDYFDVKEGNSTFSGIAASRVGNVTLTGGDTEPQLILAGFATHDLFSVLGVTPIRGRGFLPEEDIPGGESVAVIGHEMWVTRFGGDPGVTDRSLILDGESHRIVGVMGRDFSYLTNTPQVWVPLQAGPTSASRGVHSFRVIGRLAPGVGLTQAADNLSTIAAALEKEYPNDNLNRGMWPQPLRESLVGDVRPALLVLLGAVGLVLLIACVNVANLLLARGQVRDRELAVRAALGAGRARLLRQLMTESALLAGLGGAAGVGMAVAGLRLVHWLGPSVLPRQGNVAIDSRILAFTLVLALVTAVLFGLVPALRSSATDLQQPLKQGTRTMTSSRGSRRLRRSLAVVQVALAVALITGAGLLIRSFWRLNQVDMGFRADGVLVLNLVLPASRYPQTRGDWPDFPEVVAFQRDLLEQVRNIPEVRAAAIALNSPTASGWTTRFQIEGRPLPTDRQLEEIRIRTVSSGYPETVGISVVRGRHLEPRDDQPNSPPVALVNEAFAERYLSGEDPLGHRVINWGISREIVGVIQDVRFMGPQAPVPPAVYPTFARMPFGGFNLLVRTDGNPMEVLPQIRTVVGSLDGQLPLAGVGTLKERRSAQVAQPRFNMVLLSVFAAVAMILAAVGIYGVVAYGVSQRIQEMGVRISLGATRTDILRQVVGQGLALGVIGAAAGVAGSLFLTRTMSGLLFGVGAMDPTTLGTVVILVLTVTGLATLLPALRASRVDPVTALRVE